MKKSLTRAALALIKPCGCTKMLIFPYAINTRSYSHRLLKKLDRARVYLDQSRPDAGNRLSVSHGAERAER